MLSLGEVYCLVLISLGEVFLTMTLLVSLGEREEEWWAHKPGRFDNDCVDKPRGG